MSGNCGCGVPSPRKCSDEYGIFVFDVVDDRDLVDRGGKGKLTREEFVVGMWVIDQTLGGRKLPATSLPIEVWQSAQRLATFSRHQR